MKGLVTILILLNSWLSICAQRITNDTIYVCLNDTSLFVNEQYLGTTMMQHGIMYILMDTSKYQTIPINYVFSPPYDSLTHIDTFRIKWTELGPHMIKKIDYDFNGLIFFDTLTFSVLKCRKFVNPLDTIVVDSPNDGQNRGYIDDIYFPNIIKTTSEFNDRFYPFVSKTLELTNIDVIQIYNRWGGMVWESKNFVPNSYNNGWSTDEVGVYFWIMRFIVNGEVNYLSGSITVIK